MTKNIGFLLIDFETLGLNPRRHPPIEAAWQTFVNGMPGKLCSCLIKPGVNGKWDAWAVNQHTLSGLLPLALEQGVSSDDVGDQINITLDTYPNVDQWHVMGNSVHFDKRHIAVWFPRVHARLHYRILDVSAVRLAIQFMTGADPLAGEKIKAHRAVDDIAHSMRELQWYFTYLDTLSKTGVPPASNPFVLERESTPDA